MRRNNDSMIQFWSALLWPKDEAIRSAENDQQAAPPHRRVQIREHRIRKMIQFRQSAGKNEHPVNKEQNSHKKPDWDDVMLFGHFASPENDLQNHQHDQRNRSPECGATEEAAMLFPRQRRQAVHQSNQF